MCLGTPCLILIQWSVKKHVFAKPACIKFGVGIYTHVQVWNVIIYPCIIYGLEKRSVGVSKTIENIREFPGEHMEWVAWKLPMLVYPDHFQNWIDLGRALLIFLAMVPLYLSEPGHIWGFRADIIWRTQASTCRRGGGGGIFPMLCVESCLVFIMDVFYIRIMNYFERIQTITYCNVHVRADVYDGYYAELSTFLVLLLAV